MVSAIRAQLLRFAANLQALAQQLEDSVMLLGSEIWMADLAYYQSVREAAKRGGHLRGPAFALP